MLAEKVKIFLFTIFSIFLIGTLFFFGVKSVSQAKSQPQKILRAIIKKEFRQVCGKETNGQARCNAHVVTNAAGTPLGSTTPYTSSYTPLQFHTAYNLPC